MKKLLRKVTVKTIPVYILMVVLILVARPKLSFFLAGFPLIILGELLRIWAAGHLSKNKEVTTTGPYAYVKNPLYLGTFLIMTGFCLLASQWIILGVGLLAFFSYYAPFKKKAESDRLRQIFGSAWDEYDRSVPDYLPRLSPYEKRGRHVWEWSRVVSNSEHETAVVTALGVLILSMRFFF